MQPPVVVKVSHRYAAPAERVFEAWLTPQMASRFLFATRTGNIMRCQIEPWEGGHFYVTDRRPHADGDESVFDVEHSGTYLVIDRPKRLAFEFSVPPYTEAPTRVTLEFKPLSPQSCEVELSHELGSGEEARAFEAQTRTGWDRMLCALEREWFPRRVGVQL